MISWLKSAFCWVNIILLMWCGLTMERISPQPPKRSSSQIRVSRMWTNDFYCTVFYLPRTSNRALQNGWFYLHIFSTVTFCILLWWYLKGWGLVDASIYHQGYETCGKLSFWSHDLVFLGHFISNNLSLFRLLAPRVESSYFLLLALNYQKDHIETSWSLLHFEYFQQNM